MSRIGQTLKRAGNTFWHGEKYMHFNTPDEFRPKEAKPRVPFSSPDNPIEELGVLVGATGMVVTIAGAAVEFSHLASNEIGQMTILGGLGSIAIGGAVYAYGKLAE